MQFSIQWAGVSVAYVGMMFGAIMGWRTTSDESFLPFRIMTALVGTLFGGGATIPFIASNFVAAFLAIWLTRGQAFTTRFAAFATIAVALGIIVLKVLDEGFRQIGGLHLDLRTLAMFFAMLTATFALSLLLMRFAPTA